MLQYILNASIIWLACLLLFEALLRKETFHQYNRIYLLASLAAGLLLPTLNLSKLITSENLALRQPTEQVYEIKKTFSVSASPSPTINDKLNLELILWFIYLAGVLAGIVLLLREVIQLIQLYAAGTKSRESGCRIVETAKDHCPFSLFKIIFVGSRGDYDPLQWSLLLAHEREHSRLLHTMDNAALIILRIVFWFHPLPHIYYKRLKMVHEFQADCVVTTHIADYGCFLLEQSLLQGAPTITHSFNYSPIKNRIAMLTGTRSTRTKLVKYLSVIPLTFLLLLFCTQTSFSGERTRKGNKIYYKGNEVELKGHAPEPVLVEDPVTGQVRTLMVMLDTTVVALNGKPVYGEEVTVKNGTSFPGDKYTHAVFTGSGNSIHRYLFENLKSELNRLENGLYKISIDRMVVDDKGNIAYYEIEGINYKNNSAKSSGLVIMDDVKNAIDTKLAALLEGKIKFKPATIDNKPVNTRFKLEDCEGPKTIEVKDHIARLN